MVVGAEAAEEEVEAAVAAGEEGARVVEAEAAVV